MASNPAVDSIKSGKAVAYAMWCADDTNRLVPVYVRKQAQSWLDIVDGKDPEAIISDKTYIKICKLLRIMVHPDIGCTMYDGLADYAWFLITAVFCTVTRDNNGSRYYQTALLEIARKNFKTFTSAVIFVLLMLTEPKFSRFFSVAPDLKLSSELKLAVRKIIKSSPMLADGKIFKVLRSEIRCNINDSDYTPLAYSKDKMDGKLANAFLADEAGAMDGYPIEAMRSSQITLDTKLGIIISTQYPNNRNAMIDEIDISKKTLDGVLTDHRRFALLYEPDKELQTGDQWQTDDTIIYQSNPVAVKNKTVFTAITDMRQLAIIYEDKRENYLCKHNNITYKGLGAEGYVDINQVRLCRRDNDDAWWQGRDVYLGLDLSQSDDNTALAMATIVDDILYARVFGFIPKDLVDVKTKKEGVPYERLIKQGVCYACGSAVIGYDYVEMTILSVEKTYGVKVLSLGYDRYNALSTVQKLEAEGMNCVDIRQHSSVLHSPTKYLREKILTQRFCYDSNPLLEINFENARCLRDTNLNSYVSKKRSNGKVDMVVALINAVYLAEQDELNGAYWCVIT